MRGKRVTQNTYILACRNIPAYAGKTNVIVSDQPLPTEHPRVCGENEATVSGSATAGGTSPRMRGKQTHETGSFV